MSALLENEIHFTDKFTAQDDKFFLAAAMTEYDSETEIIERKEYGELIIEHYGWGYTGTFGGSHSRNLSYHQCSDEELGLVRNNDTQIFSTRESMISEVITYKKKFKCINKDDLVIWGDYNSAAA